MPVAGIRRSAPCFVLFVEVSRCTSSNAWGRRCSEINIDSNIGLAVGSGGQPYRRGCSARPQRFGDSPRQRVARSVIDGAAAPAVIATKQQQKRRPAAVGTETVTSAARFIVLVGWLAGLYGDVCSATVTLTFWGRRVLHVSRHHVTRESCQWPGWRDRHRIALIFCFCLTSDT